MPNQDTEAVYFAGYWLTNCLLCSSQATQLQTRYMELLTQSGDYHKYLGDLLKSMEELKVVLFYMSFSDTVHCLLSLFIKLSDIFLLFLTDS